MTDDARLEWLELIADYRCNQRCVGCFSSDPRAGAMSTREALEALAWGRAQGANKLWLGGGDPTLRGDLFGLVRAARARGYTRVKLQTNAMLLAYERFAAQCREAGVTEVAASLKGADAATHDALTRTPGSFELLLRGLANARAQGLALEGDVLVYRATVASLPTLVRRFYDAGVARFRVWALTAEGQDEAAVRAEVPRVREVADAVRAALEELGPGAPDDAVVSLHTPPCVLREDVRERARFFAPALRLVVANPGGHRFRLERSPMEGGLYFDACAGCSARARCGGAREDYVRAFGREEFTALR